MVCKSAQRFSQNFQWTWKSSLKVIFRRATRYIYKQSHCEEAKAERFSSWVQLEMVKPLVKVWIPVARATHSENSSENIHRPITFLLKGFTIKTFEKLLNKASNLQEKAPRMPFLKDSSSEKKIDRPVKSFEKRVVNISIVDKGN